MKRRVRSRRLASPISRRTQRVAHACGMCARSAQYAGERTLDRSAGCSSITSPPASSCAMHTRVVKSSSELSSSTSVWPAEERPGLPCTSLQHRSVSASTSAPRSTANDARGGPATTVSYLPLVTSCSHSACRSASRMSTPSSSRSRSWQRQRSAASSLASVWCPPENRCSTVPRPPAPASSAASLPAASRNSRRRGPFDAQCDAAASSSLDSGSPAAARSRCRCAAASSICSSASTASTASTASMSRRRWCGKLGWSAANSARSSSRSPGR